MTDNLKEEIYQTLLNYKNRRGYNDEIKCESEIINLISKIEENKIKKYTTKNTSIPEIIHTLKYIYEYTLTLPLIVGFNYNDKKYIIAKNEKLSYNITINDIYKLTISCTTEHTLKDFYKSINLYLLQIDKLDPDYVQYKKVID